MLFKKFIICPYIFQFCPSFHIHRLLIQIINLCSSDCQHERRMCCDHKLASKNLAESSINFTSSCCFAGERLFSGSSNKNNAFSVTFSVKYRNALSPLEYSRTLSMSSERINCDCVFFSRYSSRFNLTHNHPDFHPELCKLRIQILFKQHLPLPVNPFIQIPDI